MLHRWLISKSWNSVFKNTIYSQNLIRKWTSQYLPRKIRGSQFQYKMYFNIQIQGFNFEMDWSELGKALINHLIEMTLIGNQFKNRNKWKRIDLKLNAYQNITHQTISARSVAILGGSFKRIYKQAKVIKSRASTWHLITFSRLFQFYHLKDFKVSISIIIFHDPNFLIISP